MTTLETAKAQAEIPAEIIEEAKELARGAEILPEGYMGLARKIHAARIAGRKLRVKQGFDPTSSDLHLGHAVGFRKLRRFQEFGHQVVVIIGGFTAQIGDPTGRNSTRPPLTAEEVSANAKTYLDQMGLILDLQTAEVVNNADWLTSLNLGDIIKLVGKVTVNQLLAKEAFGDRLNKELPLGFHELFYPLLQGYDSVAINADIELGGTDQRFNILQGRELQPHYGQEPQLALLLPLLEGTDGQQKMSKTYGNYVALKDTPDDMLGKCMRIPDSLIIKYFELATTLSGAEIDAVKAALDQGGNPRDAKEKLGQQIVKQYHGADAANKAVEEWRKVHSQRQLPDEIETFKLPEPSMLLFACLTSSGLASSNSEAKRSIAEGAVRIDGEQVKDPNFVLDANSLAVPKVVQVGRRKFKKISL